MKRPMTLIGGILGTVVQCLLVYEAFTLMVLFGELLGSSTDDSVVMVMAITILLLGTSVVALIFNAVAIAAWAKPANLYKKNRGYIITAVVLNFIIVVLSLIGFSSNGAITSVAGLEILALIAAGVLFIVDLSIEGKRVAKLEQPAQEIEGVQDVEIQGATINVQPTNMTALEEKIKKLNQMKENGLLDEDEYNELKKKYIRELL